MVMQLQKDAIENNVSVESLLRRAKVIATKLNQIVDLEWIEHELSGYENIPSEEIPSYRQLIGSPKYYNPYHGWYPIVFENDEDLKTYSSAIIRLDISCIENQLNQGNIGVWIPYPFEMNNNLIQAFGNHNYGLHLDNSAFVSILNKVRNKLLDWSLELEKVGVIRDINDTTDQTVPMGFDVR